MEVEAKFIALFTAIGIIFLIPFVASTFQSTYQESASLSPSAMMISAAPSFSSLQGNASVSPDSVPAMKKSSLGPEKYESVLQTPYGKFTMTIDYQEAVYVLEDHEQRMEIKERSTGRSEKLSTPDFSVLLEITPENETEIFSNPYGWIRISRHSGSEEIYWYGGNFTYLDSERAKALSLMVTYRSRLTQIMESFSVPGAYYGVSGYAASGIYINEFLANPGTEGEEWIELYNNLSSEVSLGGWLLDDADGGSDPFTIPSNATIAGKGFLVFYGNLTKVQLNNAGDSVRLYDSNNRLVDSVSYPSSQANISMGRVPDSGSFFNMTSPSPGSSNG